MNRFASACCLGLALGCSSPAEPSSTSDDGSGGGSGGGPHEASGGASDGSGGDGSTLLEPTELIVEGSSIQVSVGNLKLIVDADTGGRIVELSRDGQNVLATAEVHSTLYGSTFWTSPQSDWEWPPVAAIDTAPYEVEVHEDTVVLRSPPWTSGGVQVEKRLTPLARERAIRITYGIVNVGNADVVFAPWEVTRVPAGGLSFFATGTLTLPQSNLAVSFDAGHTWYESSGTPLPSDQKHFADGQGGWVAHVHDRLLFLKTFEDLAPESFAPEHAEIEIYANEAGSYVEIEQQGPYTLLAPGARLDWSVDWRLERLPESIVVASGSESLLTGVADLLD